jgi:hypothetical protein
MHTPRLLFLDLSIHILHVLNLKKTKKFTSKDCSIQGVNTTHKQRLVLMAVSLKTIIFCYVTP